MENSNNKLENRVQNFRNNYFKISQEVQKCIVGMEDIVTTTRSSIFANGHVLLEGVPGLGRTLLVKTISKVLNLEFKRIQFTPDLMPTDLTGTLLSSEDETKTRDLTLKCGPIFSHIVLAYEIHRTTPKT